MLIEELIVKTEHLFAEGIVDLLFPYHCRIYFLRSSARVFLFLLLLLARLFLWSEDVFFEVVLESGHDSLHEP